MIPKYQSEIGTTLKRIRTILKEFSLKKVTDSQSIMFQINSIRTILAATLASSQKIIKNMIANAEADQQLKNLLWRKLRGSRREEGIRAESQQIARRSGEHYNLSTHTLPSLVKDVVENSRLIEEELTNLAYNLRALPKSTNGEQVPADVPLFGLLKMAMEDSSLEFSEQMNQLLFRTYILEESISLVLVKTIRIFQEIEEKLEEEAEEAEAESSSLRSSFNSEKTGKRSALSESIEVYKRNQLRQEMEKLEAVLFDSPPKERPIQTDYKMVRKTERIIKKGELRINCCF